MIPPTSHSAAIAPATLPHVAEATLPHVAHNVDAPFAFAGFEIDAGARQVRLHGAPVPVGARAFSLLLVLAERRDRVVGKDELLDLVWPGLVVAENNLSVQISALRKLLGPGCIATIPGRGYRLTAALAAPSPELPAAGPLRAPAAPAGAAFAAVPAPLFGRTAELAALHQAVQAHRLVTVVGTAGIGKTSLARALVHDMTCEMADTAALAELAALTDPALVVTTVAAALGLPPAAAAQPEALAAAVAARQVLLVLDNCEHLAESVAALATALLAGAPGVRLLVTSQVPLRLAQEQLLRLGPLDLPQAHEAQAGGTADRARQAGDTVTRARLAGAVALFEARAQTSDPRFVLDEQNVAGVVDICHHLDGVPLALELAAARVRWLGVEGLRARLGERLRLLSGGTRLALPRHQTLRAALDWSHALLSADEQAVFRRLGVFAGGFSLAAVQQLACDAQIDEWAALDLLGQLIDKSLVVADLDGTATRAAGAVGEDAAQPRYRLLESLREYAVAQLLASGEQDAWRQRHAAFFRDLTFAHGGSTAYLRSVTDRWPLVLDHDNLRCALDWAVESDAALGLRMAAELLPFWRERGHHAEAQARCSALLAQPANQHPSTVRARVRLALCALANERNQTDRLRALASAVLADARALGDRSLESLGHIWLAHADLADDDLDAAEGNYRQALAIVRELNEPARVAETLTNIASILIERGQPADSQALLVEALALYRAGDNVWGLGFAMSTMGEAAYALGDFDTALACAQEGLAHHRRLQHQHRLSYSLLQCGQTLLRLGRLDEARADLAEGLAVSTANGFHEQTTIVFVQAAWLAVAGGQPERAALLLGAAQGNIERGGALVGRPDRAEFARAQQRVKAGLSAQAWDAAWEAGLALPQRAAAALALVPVPVPVPHEA